MIVPHTFKNTMVGLPWEAAAHTTAVMIAVYDKFHLFEAVVQVRAARREGRYAFAANSTVFERLQAFNAAERQRGNDACDDDWTP